MAKSRYQHKSRKVLVQMKRKNARKQDFEKDNFLETLLEEKHRIDVLASEEGTSYLMNVLSITKSDLKLSNSVFPERLHIRNRIEPGNLLVTCTSGHDLTFVYAWHCHKGVYTNLRQNKIRVTKAKFVFDVRQDVQIEPVRPLQGERSDNMSSTKEAH